MGSLHVQLLFTTCDGTYLHRSCNHVVSTTMELCNTAITPQISTASSSSFLINKGNYADNVSTPEHSEQTGKSSFTTPVTSDCICHPPP